MAATPDPRKLTGTEAVFAAHPDNAAVNALQPSPPTPNSIATNSPSPSHRRTSSPPARPSRPQAITSSKTSPPSTGTRPSRASSSPITSFRTLSSSAFVSSSGSSWRRPLPSTQHHLRLALRQLLRARSLRPLRRPLRRSPQPEAHHDARRLAGPSAAQGLSRRGVPLMAPPSAAPDLIDPASKTSSPTPAPSRQRPPADHTMVLNMGPQHP